MLDITSSAKFFVFKMCIFNECVGVVLVSTVPELLMQTWTDCHLPGIKRCAALTMSSVLASLSESMLARQRFAKLADSSLSTTSTITLRRSMCNSREILICGNPGFVSQYRPFCINMNTVKGNVNITFNVSLVGVGCKLMSPQYPVNVVTDTVAVER